MKMPYPRAVSALGYGFMKKQLILFRHGKSDWNTETSADHDRPVAKRGIKAAKVMGRLLTLAHRAPDSVVTSSAVRARTTVELAAEAGNWTCPIRVTDDLYEATPAKVLQVMHQEPDTTHTLLFAGHEPTWSEMAARLIGGGNIEFPTAAMACIGFEIPSWTAANFGAGTLQWFLRPKFFTEGDFDFA